MALRKPKPDEERLSAPPPPPGAGAAAAEPGPSMEECVAIAAGMVFGQPG